MRKLLILIGLLAPDAGLQAAVSATVDSQVLIEKEAVELRVTADQDSPGEPDFSPLNDNFLILRQNSGTQITTINGQTTRLRTWTLLLAPQGTGKLQIPPIAVGQDRSQAIGIEIAKANPQAGQTAPAFIEFVADTTQPYVRQQVLLTVKLFVSGQLASGGLSDPSADGAVIEQLGEQRESQAIRGQTRYRVFERDYVLFAEAAGPLGITPPSFTGELRSGRSPRALFNFGGLGDTRTVVASGDAITLDVQPPPAQAPADRWLPARSVTLTQRLLPADAEPQVGVPLTREITLNIDGQLHTQVAPLELQRMSGAQVYAEQPDGNTQGVPGRGVRSSKTHRWAVIPQAAGPLTLPAVSVAWWDTDTNTLQRASLPPTPLNVMAAAAATNAALAPAPVADRAQDVIDSAQASAQATQQAATWWPLVAALAALGWLLTALAWAARAWQRQRPFAEMRRHGAATQRSHRAALDKACKAEDARAARSHLLAWAAFRFDEPNLSRLASLRAIIKNQGAEAALLQQIDATFADLDAAAFGTANTGKWRSISKLLPQIEALAKPLAAAKTLDLPPLYPA